MFETARDRIRSLELLCARSSKLYVSAVEEREDYSSLVILIQVTWFSSLADFEDFSLDTLLIAESICGIKSNNAFHADKERAIPFFIL